VNYDHLRTSLFTNDILYITGRNTPYTFREWTADGSLRFNIPSRIDGNRPNIKTIPKNILTGQEAANFTDCRLTVLKALIQRSRKNVI